MTHGSEKRRRTDHLGIRFIPAERAAIESAAERAGLSVGSYARHVLLGAPPPRQGRRPPIERRELARLLGHFGHLGSNINQIARVLNGGGEADFPALEDGLAALIDMRDAVLNSLGRSP